MFALEKIGDVGSFSAKLQKLVEENYLVSQHQDILKTAFDAGSAAAHRGYKPSQKVLNHVVNVVENLL